MQKILVPVDFSEPSEAALKYAIHFAQVIGAEIILLHVACAPLPSATNYHLHIGLLKEEIEKGKEKLTYYTNQYTELNYLDGSGKLKITPILESENGILPSIEKAAKQHNAFLVVMGTHGMTRAEEILLGSVTADVIASEKTPAILAIPSNSQFTPWERIVYAGDFSEKDKTVIEILLELASYFSNAKVDYLHISNEKEHIEDIERLHYLKAAFKQTPVSMLDFRFRENDDLDDGIDSYLEDYETSVLVMLTQHRGFFESLWHRSKAKEISFHTDIPLLVLKTNTI
ncbi:universal stress protein [Bernardetia sp.]|uniref:universal stress protein n=1 Tax=Bernardetia sp. TaxID=1937974 RepID=UPI0025BD452A|nr:universal stress protein [Bernardetia sp.]